MKNETLQGIAHRVGCSVSTVSRVLNGNASKYRISETTASKIVEIAEKINYTPSLLAKALRTNKTDTIGLVIPNIENAFFANIAGAIIRETRNYNYKVVVVDTQEHSEFEKEAVSSLLARHVDGILIVPCGKDKIVVQQILKNKIPLVQIDRYFKDADNLSYVSSDNYLGAVTAIKYLIENGHKSIACIQGPNYSIPAMIRTKAYRDTLIKYGLQDYIEVRGNEFSVQNGYIETKLLLSKENRPTAIFAQSNLILLGTVNAVIESALKIPDDISVISFDDNIMFNYLNPAITCIAQPISEISILAVKILMKEIHEENKEVLHICLPPKLIIRNSVKNMLQL